MSSVPSHFDVWTRIVVAVFLLTFVLAEGAWAQSSGLPEVPVLSIQPDPNGVDLASGAYVARSPFSFHTPGAGRLQTGFLFNGRTTSFDLNIYISDATFTWWGDDPNRREIVLNLGGVSKLFICQGFGICSQAVSTEGVVGIIDDGSRLTRGVGDNYVFVDRDGTEIEFFPLRREDVPPESHDPEDANWAVFKGTAHARYIRYPNGEVLSYSPFISSEQIGGVYHGVYSIESSLGYRLDVSFPWTPGGASSSNPGDDWVSFFGGYDGVNLFRLFRGSTLVRSIRSSESGYFNQIGSIHSKIQQDDLGRIFLLEFTTRSAGYCGMYDLTLSALDDMGVDLRGQPRS